jgi:RNA polymerase sigma-70 factor (ECF subfamily)
MQAGTKQARFEREVMPHLDAAYSLARWLLRDPHDAEDAAQEATLRAYRFLDSFRGGNAKAWLLAIVRNCCFTQSRGRRPESLDDAPAGAPEARTDSAEAYAMGLEPAASPESALIEKDRRDLIDRCLLELPDEFREVVVLRDLEGLMYKEISDVIAAPMGTVMSRLSRGRALLHKAVSLHVTGGA